MSTFEMDGTRLFAQLADKVARGEIIITHFVANLYPDLDRRQYGVSMRGEVFTVQSARTKLDMRVTAVENPGREAASPTLVSMQGQVRELIFDEEPTPVYDEELK